MSSRPGHAQKNVEAHLRLLRVETGEVLVAASHVITDVSDILPADMEPGKTKAKNDNGKKDVDRMALEDS